MRIALVTDAVYPYSKGGKEARTFELSTRLAKRGHEVHIYTMKWWPEDTLVKKENGVYLHAICPLYEMYKNDKRTTKQGILYGLACFKLLKEPFDVVEVDQIPFFPLFSVKLVTLLRRKPMYITWHEVWGRNYWVKYMGTSGNIAAIIEKASSLLSRHIVAVSEHTAEELQRTLRYKHSVKKVFNGIDFSLFDSLPNIKRKTIDCLYAGRLIEHKNVDQLVRAIALLNSDSNAAKVTCKIIGEGRERRRLEHLSAELGQNSYISFQDFLPEKEDIYKEMQTARIFVTPSTREGFGITVLEANACGTPVITSNDPNNAGRQLVLEGSTGTICTAKAADIAVAIRSWLNEAPNQEAIKAHARMYDWESQVDRQMEAYQS